MSGPYQSACIKRSAQLQLPLAWATYHEQGSRILSDGTLLPHICRYISGRVRRGEVTQGTASACWSPLTTLAKAHGHRPVDHLGRGTLLRWKELRSHLKPSTQTTQWSMVVGFCDWLAAEKLIGQNPCSTIRAPRRPRSVPRALESDDVARTLEVAPDARAKAIVWLMVDMGLRCCEVSGLGVEDWLRKDQLMRVTGKGRHEREVPVPGGARRALDAYLAEHPASSGPLFRGYTNSSQHDSLKPGTLSHYVSAWMLAAGVKHASGDGVSAHALRHTAASDVLDRCGDLRVVGEMLGHRHLSSSAPYLRRAGMGRMREAMEGRTYRRAPTDAA